MNIDLDWMTRFRERIARSESYSAEQMELFRLDRLAAICDQARRNTVYYRKRLAPLFARGEFDFARWQEVPVLTRELTRSRYLELRATRLPPRAGDSEEQHTSGSTGAPLSFMICAMQMMVAQAFSQRGYDWWGMDGAKNFGGIHIFIGEDHHKLAEQGRQGWRYDAPIGKNYGCPLHWSTDFMFDWLERKNIRYLSTRPAMAEMLAEAALEKGIRPRLEALLTVGGPLTQATRDICMEAFGLPIRDTYGSTECGNLAIDCPQCGMLHINEENALVEIVHDDGTPCAPGEVGRLLITPFYSHAMPLIRYDSGDFAQLADQPNICGRVHRSLRRVLGRESEAFLRRDGSRFFPITSAKLCAKYMAFEQMQFVQTDYDTIELRYVKSPHSDRLDRAGLERHLQQEFGPNLVTRLVPVPEIPRGPAAKFLYHRCEIDRPPPALLAKAGRR